MKRRDFLKYAGLGSLSFAASACTSETDKTIFSLVQAPADMVTGVPTWYASTCRECPAGCGIIAKNREGRVIKVEGNPLHPINRGKLCIRGHASLQGLYNPDRLKSPLLKTDGGWQGLSYAKALDLLRERAESVMQKGAGKVRMLTELVGPSQLSLFKRCLNELKSDDPVIIEPLAYESLKTANREAFGIDGLPSYRLDQADLLISLGADFLETWLSPVEYAAKFKAMHSIGYNHKGKGFFFHISPYQSLTGANADQWLNCLPGSEVAVVWGLIKAALEHGRGYRLPQSLVNSLRDASKEYTTETVVRMSGLNPEQLEALKKRLLKAKAPLVFGAGAGIGVATYSADLAANLLNLVMDPQLRLFDFNRRHRVEQATRRSDLLQFFNSLGADGPGLMLINNANPVYALPPGSGVRKALNDDRRFVVSFANFMDETTALADLVIPVALPLETWDEFGGHTGLVSLMQPAMGRWREAPAVGDVMLDVVFKANRPMPDYKSWMMSHLHADGVVQDNNSWFKAVQTGGIFSENTVAEKASWQPMKSVAGHFKAAANIGEVKPSVPFFTAVPSIRFFDGRGANRPWLCEIPDPLTKVTWQTPVMGHPETLKAVGAHHGDIIAIETKHGKMQAIAYETAGIAPGMWIMGMGQGHTQFGRYAEEVGVNPIALLGPQTDDTTGGPSFSASVVAVSISDKHVALAHTDGSRIQHGRKIALSTHLDALHGHGKEDHGHAASLTMEGFPMTLPLVEGYDPKRDFYPPHEHDTYRWAMAVDLDKCIGCAACAAACYAENNIGIVGIERVLEGREMAWIRVERYIEEAHPERITFFPMMCQHCDNAPCEPVCPVYAPHHSKEGLNNQIYNRCIGTRFCAQNCPYKVRRFNWFEWEWPEPLNLQLNPDVTVRSKGVMEKCSFCVQRIKVAHGTAKDEKREIQDGEVVPACVQTCPTGALTFGNLKDVNSRVRKLTKNTRAYQAMGYVNAKPAVIYLKKVIQES